MTGVHGWQPSGSLPTDKNWRGSPSRTGRAAYAATGDEIASNIGEAAPDHRLSKRQEETDTLPQRWMFGLLGELIMEDTVLGRVAALQAMSTPKLPARQRTGCLRRSRAQPPWLHWTVVTGVTPNRLTMVNSGAIHMLLPRPGDGQESCCGRPACSC